MPKSTAIVEEHPSDAEDIEPIRSAFDAYLDAYFTRRDGKAVDGMLSRRVTGYGTGRDETTFGELSMRDLFERDLASAPNTVVYRMQHCAIRRLDRDCGVVIADMDISTLIAQQQMTFRDLRMTLIFCRQADRWLIEHLHVSLPTVEHGEDEAFPVKELEERNAALTRLVEERTEQLNSALSYQRQMAITDQLTGLYNRRMLDEQLLIDVDRARRYQSSFALLMVDIDHFKAINDRFGHSQGDRFLVQFAYLIRQRLRKSDLFGRWGGEEFLVICHGSNESEAQTIAEDLRAAVEAADFGLEETRSISIGLAVFRPDDSLHSLIERADRGLYQAKSGGRNRVGVAA